MSNVAGYLSRATADSSDDVGEWQVGVLRRNAKGMNTGSTLFALMSRLRNENADSQTYNWWEKDPTRRVFYLAANVTDVATQFQFDNTVAATPTYDNGSLDQSVYALLKAGAILESTVSGERITVVAAGTSYATGVTVSRGTVGYSGVATAAVSHNRYEPFVLITLAKPNGSNPVDSAFTQPSKYLNYCQTFNSTASVDNAYVNGILRTDLDGPWYEQKVDALERIANDIELAYFFGVAAISGSTYTTGGIRNAIDTASLTANALNADSTTKTVTLDAFDNWVQSFMTQGSDTKLAFCGPNAYSAISKFANTAAGGYRIMQGESDSIFGLNLTTIQTPFGRVDLASHPLFKNIPSYNGTMMVVDLELICQKTFEKLFFQEYEPTNGSDTRQGQFRAKLGIKQKFPAAFGYANNISRIVA